MKHHGGAATRPPRAPARSTRFSSERHAASSSSLSASLPPQPSTATRASVNFWNQYQAFLGTNTGSAADELSGSGGLAGGQGQSGLEMPQLSDSPVRSQLMMEMGSGIGSLEKEEDEEVDG